MSSSKHLIFGVNTSSSGPEKNLLDDMEFFIGNDISEFALVVNIDRLFTFNIDSYEAKCPISRPGFDSHFLHWHANEWLLKK